MVNPDPETEEYVEFVNISAHPIRLNGLIFGVLGQQDFSSRVQFWGGCLPPNERLTIYSNQQEPLAKDRITEGLFFDAYRFRFSNSRASRLQIRDQDNRLIDGFTIKPNLIKEDISLNRFPDGVGFEIVRHDQFFDAQSSPGLSATPTVGMRTHQQM